LAAGFGQFRHHSFGHRYRAGARSAENGVTSSLLADITELAVRAGHVSRLRIHGLEEDRMPVFAAAWRF